MKSEKNTKKLSNTEKYFKGKSKQKSITAYMQNVENRKQLKKILNLNVQNVILRTVIGVSMGGFYPFLVNVTEKISAFFKILVLYREILC